MKEYSLNFTGYYRDEVIDTSLPHDPGIYLVYRGVNKDTKTCILKELIYIGESGDIHDRHVKDGEFVHEHYQDFLNACKNGETPYYAYAKLTGGVEDRQRVEAAMINQMKPRLNSKNTKTFNDPATTVKVSGSCLYVDKEIVMQ